MIIPAMTNPNFRPQCSFSQSCSPSPPHVIFPSGIIQAVLEDGEQTARDYTNHTTLGAAFYGLGEWSISCLRSVVVF